MVLLLLAFLLLLAAPAEAAIEGPTRAKKLALVDAHDPLGGKRLVVFVDTRGRILRFDARTRRITRVRLPKTCAPILWDGDESFLIDCGYDEDRTYRLLRGARRRTEPYPGIRPGDYLEVFGRRWACGEFVPEGGDERDQPHELCVNRRSGRRIVFTPEQETSCGRDVDDERLRPYERCTYDAFERWRDWRLDPEAALLLWRKGQRKRKLLKWCSFECDGRLVDGRVTWWREAGRAGLVHLLDLRSGRRWRWRVSPIVQPEDDFLGDPLNELRTMPTDAGLLILRGRRQSGDAVGPYDLHLAPWPRRR